MSIQNIALALVFVSNVAAIGLLTYMLFRILGQTQETQDMMVGQSRKLEEAGKRLIIMLSHVDRLNERLLKAQQQGEDSDAGSAAQAQAHDAPKVTDELNHLRQQLDEANATITELRLANRPADVGPKPADLLREELQQQKMLSDNLKDRLQKAEEAVKSLKQESAQLTAQTNAQLSAQMAQAQEDKAKSLAALREQLDIVTKDRDAVQQQLNKLNASMTRTLLEKDLIEEKLLDLDARVHQPAQASAPQAASDTPSS